MSPLPSKCNIKIMHIPFVVQILLMISILKEKLCGRKLKNKLLKLFQQYKTNFKQAPEMGLFACFKRLVKKWNYCIFSGGRYFEKE